MSEFRSLDSYIVVFFVINSSTGFSLFLYSKTLQFFFSLLFRVSPANVIISAAGY